MLAGPPPPTIAEHELLEAARRGDEQAYTRLVEPHRASLHAHCYRMLGSLHDAEDALQDALLAAWRGLARFEGRSTLRTWLFAIATHACLRAGVRRSRRILPIEYGPPSHPHVEVPGAVESSRWLEPYPDDVAFGEEPASPATRYEQRESVELAFVAALQHLPATQRAVLILRDVLGFAAEEVARALDTSVASANSALQRARRTLDRRRPAVSQQAWRRSLGDAAHRALVERFVAAWSRADVDSIVAMLAADATFTMPPLPMWFRGQDDIRAFLADRVFALRWRFLPAHASRQPAMAAYRWNEEAGSYRLDLLNVFDLRGDRVAGMTAFLGHELCRRFGLPTYLPA